MVFNWDILVCLLPYLTIEPRQLLPFMKTCRTLYEAGIPFLYGDHTSIDYRWKPVRSLHDTLVSNPRYANYIRKLSISGVPEDYEKGAEEFVPKILALCHALEDLAIADAEAYMEYPGFTEAMLSLKHVTKLTLQLVGPVTVKALEETGWSVIRAHIGPSDNYLEDERVEELAPLNPLEILSPFAESLTHLYVYYPDDMKAPEGVCYPRMTSVVIAGHVDPCYLISAFPNLTEFDWVEGSDIEKVEHADHYRRDRVEYEGSGNAPQARGRPSWASLDFLASSISRVYSMALTCPVRVWDSRVRAQVLHVPHFHTALQDIRPTHVLLNVWVFRCTLAKIADLFPPANITHLFVKLDLLNCPDPLTAVLVSGAYHYNHFVSHV